MPQKYLRTSLFAILIILLIVGVVWLIAGRLPLFQSSSYISVFALDTAVDLYKANTLWLDTDSDVKQSFTAVYPGLDEVSVLLARPGENLSQEATITFDLKENCDSSDYLRRIIAPVSAIEDNSFYSFSFTPIDGSAGETYCFVLAQSNPLNEQRVGVWASIDDVYAAGSASYQWPMITNKNAQVAKNIAPPAQAAARYKVSLPVVYADPSGNVPTDFDTGFHLHYNGRPVEAFVIFANRLISYKPYFWGNRLFYIFLVGAYFIGVALLARIKLN